MALLQSVLFTSMPLFNYTHSRDSVIWLLLTGQAIDKKSDYYKLTKDANRTCLRKQGSWLEALFYYETRPTRMQ